jgi:hypothetical protein
MRSLIKKAVENTKKAVSGAKKKAAQCCAKISKTVAGCHD